MASFSTFGSDRPAIDLNSVTDRVQTASNDITGVAATTDLYPASSLTSKTRHSFADTVTSVDEVATYSAPVNAASSIVDKISYRVNTTCDYCVLSAHPVPVHIGNNSQPLFPLSGSDNGNAKRPASERELSSNIDLVVGMLFAFIAVCQILRLVFSVATLYKPRTRLAPCVIHLLILLLWINDVTIHLLVGEPSSSSSCLSIVVLTDIVQPLMTSSFVLQLADVADLQRHRTAAVAASGYCCSSARFNWCPDAVPKQRRVGLLVVAMVAGQAVLTTGAYLVDELYFDDITNGNSGPLRPSLFVAQVTYLTFIKFSK